MSEKTTSAPVPSGGVPMKISEAVIRFAGNSQDGIQAIGGFLARLGQGRPDLAGCGVEWDPMAAARARAKSGAAVARGSVNALPPTNSNNKTDVLVSNVSTLTGQGAKVILMAAQIINRAAVMAPKAAKAQP